MSDHGQKIQDAGIRSKEYIGNVGRLHHARLTAPQPGWSFNKRLDYSAVILIKIDYIADRNIVFLHLCNDLATL